MVFGFAEPGPVMVLFAVAFALLMNRIRHSRLSSTDTVIGVFSSCGVALGLVILSRGGGFSKYQSLLIGDILSISGEQLLVLGFTLAVVPCSGALFQPVPRREHSPPLARSKGLPVGLLDNLFVVVIAVVVMLSIQLSGAAPHQCHAHPARGGGRNVARSMRSYLLLTLVFSLFSGLLGLGLSYLNAVATGPTIVLVSAALFFGTYGLARRAK